MRRRDYRRAAELYDQALSKQPNDPALLAKRTEARHGVLGQRDAWAMQLDERLAPALAAEVGMAGNDNL